MALGATVYKATIAISDVDRGYYGTHLCTLARHPSENEERLSIRLLAFCLYVGETDMRLHFGKLMIRAVLLVGSMSVCLMSVKCEKQPAEAIRKLCSHMVKIGSVHGGINIARR